MREACRLWLGVALVMAVVAGVAADTLHLRDGSRIEGELLSIRDGIVEFQPDRGRLLRVEQVDVRRIEFDDRGQRGRGSVGSFAPEGGRRPAGLRERRVTVHARSGWSDSGIDVRAGQTVFFDATGQVTWGRGRRDGPAGERNSPENDARPLPTRPAAALIGRVGDDSAPFFIGDETGGLRLRESGRLFLGVNDDYLADNNGNFRVVVYY
jgi:hypothetical protein